MSGQKSFSGTEARLLLRRARTGTLASLDRDTGIPYASLVNVATDVRGWPLILISALAWHTRNLMADPRASLLVAEMPETGDALTGARVTVMGRFEKAGEPSLKRRYLARHPEAEIYVGFGDFALWRLVPEQAHAVAGFGRIETMAADEVFPSCDEISNVEESAIQHMNLDHQEAIQLYASRLLAKPAQGWSIAAIDPDGVDLRSAENGTVRLAFDAPVKSADGLRQVFAMLARKFRADS